MTFAFCAASIFVKTTVKTLFSFGFSGSGAAAAAPPAAAPPLGAADADAAGAASAMSAMFSRVYMKSQLGSFAMTDSSP